MAPDSYLGSVLADAKRGFRYRSGAAWLLGQPDAIGPHPMPLRLPRGGFPYVRPHDAAPLTGASASRPEVWESSADATGWPDSPFWPSTSPRGGGDDPIVGVFEEDPRATARTDWPAARLDAPVESAAGAEPSVDVRQDVHDDATPGRPVRRQREAARPETGGTQAGIGGSRHVRAPGAVDPPHGESHPLLLPRAAAHSSSPRASSPAGRPTGVHTPSEAAVESASDPRVAPEEGAAEPDAFRQPPMTTSAGTTSGATTFIQTAAQAIQPTARDRPGRADRPLASHPAEPDSPLEGLPPAPARTAKLTTVVAASADAAPWPAEAAHPSQPALTPRRSAGAPAVDPPSAEPVRPHPAPQAPQSESLSIRPAGADPYGGVPAFWVRRHLRARHLRVLR